MKQIKRLNILYIGNALSKHGSTPTSIETLAPLLGEFNNITIASDKKNYFLRIFDMIYSLIKQRNSLDTIIIDTYSTKNFYYALLISQLARVFNINYLTCLRGGNLPDRLNKTSFFSKLIFNNSVINIAPSKYLEDAFLKHNYNVYYISNNIQLNMYKYKQRNKLKPSILYVRAFSSIYNPQMAIKAFSKFKNIYTDANMCMVGPDKDGTLNDCITLAKKLNIYNSINFIGKLSKVEWIKLSNDYDIFINPTNFDNQPVSVMESMALGFPIISTNVGGLSYLIEDGVNGLLVEANDDKMLFEKMLLLMNNSSLSEKLSKNARKKAETFDWQSIKKQWIEVLKCNVKSKKQV